ncbi:unnamed protein product [Eruca vesicaria subsp. sativa]|uniref:F-box domain-containing protein n=1 Tax=Eruca vesicaria subsp. sativa TaxID=29727 RepID=A0ABC8L142_ERUVS|nr:unnamed protein product [Eruca vesicaria subsp. sativa]
MASPPRKRSNTPSVVEAVNPSFDDLPSSLLEVIMSRLVLKDNIRASASCKTWREAAISVRVVEEHPWLFCFPKRGTSFELRDPLHSKSYTLNLPELADSTLCYSRDGWLLMRRSVSKDMFFFNPFSQELVTLPKFEESLLVVAFSCPPTSDHCVVGLVSALSFDVEAQERRITISTWHPGATEWITQESAFHSRFPGYYTKNSKLFYLNKIFYFFHFFSHGGGNLYSFHTSSRTWCFHYAYVFSEHQFNYYQEASFLAEKNGELFLMLTSGNEKPLIYKLVSLHWVKMSITELDGLTFFVSYYNSEVRLNLPWMRNNVYFSRFGYNRKRCVSYSFDESMYSPSKEWHNWLQLCPPQSIWIVPPKNVLDYLSQLHGN